MTPAVALIPGLGHGDDLDAGVVKPMRPTSGILPAVVVGDHGDAIGRYHHPALLAADNDIDPGLLTTRGGVLAR